MAVYSMTGFASATQAASDAAPGTPEGTASSVTGIPVHVELRSVNSRFLDVVLRMPDELRSLEPALREAVGARFKRGKIEVRVTVERGSEAGQAPPRPEQLAQLARLQQAVRDSVPDVRPLSVYEALQWCRGAASPVALDEPALTAGRLAIERLREAREREGARLVAILDERVAQLRALATQAAPLVPQVVARQQQRFLDRWSEALGAAGAGGAAGSPENLRERALSEAASFALRIDVAEELSRLGAHLDEISRLLKAGGEVGKRLDFLIQELHREANTLGSKAAALELTQISVEMKVAIEQMREQVQNIE